MATPLLHCTGLSIGYRDPLLPPLDVSIGKGEFWAVVGRNGSGKSTWFRTMLGLLPPLAGQVHRGPGVKLGYVAQRRTYDELYPVTVREVVAMGLLRKGSWLGFGAAEVTPALQAVAAADLADRTFRSLSEGQKQRVLLARLVASNADIAFLDEPTAAMDAVAEAEAMTLLDQIRQTTGMTIVVVSHHLDQPRRRATHALFFDPDQGLVVAGRPDEVFDHPAFLSRYREITGEVSR